MNRLAANDRVTEQQESRVQGWPDGYWRQWTAWLSQVELNAEWATGSDAEIATVDQA